MVRRDDTIVLMKQKPHDFNDFYINETNLIDPETGEILKTCTKYGWNGWKDKAYKYRYRNYNVTLFVDMDFSDLNPTSYRVLMEIARYMNTENLLVYYQRGKKKYDIGQYIPYTKDQIFEKISYMVSRSTFNRVWKSLSGKYIKKIKVSKLSCYAVNPAFVLKGGYIPVYLYTPFKNWINPYLSALAIKRFEEFEIETYGENG